ncbi:MAG: VOC family protein [Pseudomonadota bacterium]
MLGYVTIGTKDLDKALAFYDAVLKPLGGERKFPMPEGRGHFYAGNGHGMVAVCRPYDGNEATSGNGTMVALDCPDHDTVKAVYDAAIAAGATGDGEPGERIPGVFYGAYFHDPDGNKLCAYKMG